LEPDIDGGEDGEMEEPEETGGSWIRPDIDGDRDIGM